jgi:DNA-binding NtrC family response regulator
MEGHHKTTGAFMRRRILVIDDDADTLELISTLLHQKINTLTALNLDEAFEIVKREFVDVVICDINLGKENGFQLIEELKNNLLEIPFIIVSGDVDPEKELRAKKLGAMAIMEKPFHFESLIEIIDRNLDPIVRFKASKARRVGMREAA